MRSVKIKLREPNPFWIMKPISLQRDDDESPFINVDVLTERQTQVINMSVNNKEVFLIGPDNKVLDGGLEVANVFEGNFVSVDDVPEEDQLPDIISVTVPLPEEEDEDTKEEITEEIKENAKILLSQNGNTVRATIKSLPDGSNSLLLLHACHEFELDGKNRTGVLCEIQTKMMES